MAYIAPIGAIHSPELLSDIHALVNKHRKYYGLPEWDFNSKPHEQWWKSIPAVNAMVNRIWATMRGHHTTLDSLHNRNGR